MDQAMNHIGGNRCGHEDELEEFLAPKLVEPSIMMKHLQTALAKIDNLEAEIHCLKNQINEKEEHFTRDSRGRDDEVIICNGLMHGIEPTNHQKSNTLMKHLSAKPLRKKKSKKQDRHFLFRNYDNDDSKVSNTKTAPFVNEKNDGGWCIPINHDEENVGANDFLALDGPASYGQLSSEVAKVNVESGLSCSNTENIKLLIKLELDQMNRKHIQSIEKLEKDHAKLCKKQAMTSEEVRSLLVTSKNGDHLLRESTIKERGMTMFGRAPSILLDSGLVTSLTEDTFSLMMTSRICSTSWILGCFSFGFQISLGIMIVNGQFSGPTLTIPFKVESTSFRVAQFLSIILSLSTQIDILTSIRSFFLLGAGSNWVNIIGEEGRRPSRGLWIVRVGLPNTMKLSQGLLVTFVSFVIIIENKNTIQLLKDFTSLMVISEFDNILFHLASYGYLGEELRLEAERIVDMEVTTGMNSTSAHRHKRNDVNFVRLAFVALLLSMFAGWGVVFHMQSTGIIFDQEFPGCGKENYKLAYNEFNNGECYGGPFNTINCNYEDGDCSNFNTEYPNCNGDDLIALHNVEKEVGNSICNMTFAIPQCEYDGGDCCPYDIHLSPSFGDGMCNGGRNNIKGCLYDNGDCDIFNSQYPNCPKDHDALADTTADVILGNGICEGGGYDVEKCGFEFGDCDRAQVGQDLVLNGVLSPTSRKIDFNMRMSADGSKILVDMPGTNKAGRFDSNSNGTITGYVYNSTASNWTHVEGMNKERTGGFAIDINNNGSAVAVGVPGFDNLIGRVYIFNFSDPVVPTQILNGSLKNALFGFRLDLSDDGFRIAVSSPWYNKTLGMIQIFERNNFEQELSWMQVGNNIYGETKEYIGKNFLHLNSLDGTRVFFDADDSRLRRGYQFNGTSQQWVQLGSDLQHNNVIDVVFSADGNRFAESYLKTQQSDSHGEIKIYEWNTIHSSSEGNWKQVGPAISSRNYGFGRSMSMNADGTLLATSTVNPSCDGLNHYDNKSIELCSTGTLQLYYYKHTNPPHRPFSELPMNARSIMVEEKQVRDEIIFGLQVSLSRDGSSLAVSGYNLGQSFGFVKVYNVSDLFYIDCIVEHPEKIGDGICNNAEPYYTESCGFDEGDCPPSSSSDKYPDCKVVFPSFIGTGECYMYGSLPYNSKQCEFDGNDCPRPSSVEGYPNCFVSYPEKISDGLCHDSLPYNSYDCGFDGGDCIPSEFRPTPSPLESLQPSDIIQP